MKYDLIVRYSVPNEYDQHEYGTGCKVYTDKSNTRYNLYLQLSRDSESPQWDLLGDFGNNSLMDHDLETIISHRLG